MEEQIEIKDEKTELERKAEELYKNREAGAIRVIAVYKDGTKKKVRIARSTNGSIIVMKSANRGYSINQTDIIDFKEIDLKAEWQKSISKAIKILEESGLWKDLLTDLKTANAIGYEKLQEAYKITDMYFISDKEKAEINIANELRDANITLNQITEQLTSDKHPDLDIEKVKYYYLNPTRVYDLNEKIKIEKIKQIDSRLIEKTEDGKEIYNSNILWHLSKPLKIKKMYFEKYKDYNNLKLKEIKEALQNKQPITIKGRTNYDVSFYYKPDENKAWYDEEFRNCGNGHYYLALSDTYAMFYEDD